MTDRLIDWIWTLEGEDDDMTVPVLFDDGFESEPEGDDDD